MYDCGSTTSMPIAGSSVVHVMSGLGASPYTVRTSHPVTVATQSWPTHTLLLSASLNGRGYTSTTALKLAVFEQPPMSAVTDTFNGSGATKS